jgi:hypothetical protein
MDMRYVVFILALFMAGELLSIPLAALLALPLIAFMKPLTAHRPVERVLAVLFIPAAALTAVAVCVRLAAFVGDKSLPDTPVWLIALVTGGLGLYCVWGGGGAVKGWAAFTFPLVAGFIVLSAILLTGKFHSGGIFIPRVWENNPLLIACEGVTLLAVMPALKYTVQPLRAYLLALAAAIGIGGAVWAIGNFTLGAGLAEAALHPFYTALRIAKGGEIIGRLEGFSIPVMLCAAVLKTAACLLVIAHGVKVYKAVSPAESPSSAMA